MKLLVLVLTLIKFEGCLAIITKITGPLAPKDFVHRVTLDEKGSYIMLWTPLEKKIDIEIQVLGIKLSTKLSNFLILQCII